MAYVDPSPSTSVESTKAVEPDPIEMAERIEAPGGVEPTNTVPEKQRDDGKLELKEEDAYEHLGFCFPTWKKWCILSVIFMVQTSMNFNASVYGNAISGMTQAFDVSEAHARKGQMIFLIAYAFGCELWAPWSEQYGRWIVLQLSMTFVNLWQIPCALAPTFEVVMAFRFLAGLSLAGGSVTLGMVADMWEPAVQQYAVGFIVLSSVGGSVVGPIVGGFVEEYASWQWVFWLQLIFGAATQAAHFFTPETRASVLLNREAKRRRAAGQTHVYGPDELREHGLTVKEVLKIWSRPFWMFVLEPIVLFLSLLSGFSDALIFTFLESYGPVFEQWGFGPKEIGLAFVPLALGYLLAYASFIPVFRRHVPQLAKDPEALAPEARLWWLLYTAPLLTVGLFGFAWTSLGPPTVPWIAPMVFSCLIGIANYAIYMATIDYMIAAYGPYAASATGGNGFARDFLAGIAALYAEPLYHRVGRPYNLEWGSTILGCLAILVTIPIYVFYWFGPRIRARSRFAQELKGEILAKEERRKSSGFRRAAAAGAPEMARRRVAAV